MTDRPEMGIQDARTNFRSIADAAIEQGTITTITRHGRPIMAVVPHAWLVRADAALAQKAQEHE